jgi:tRNA modification GTPase
MNFLYDEKPIIACSTGTNSNTAIALIRLSGFDNLIKLQHFFSFDLTKAKPRYSHLTNIVLNESVLDNCLMVYFPNTSSFTGENVLELSVHGNQLNVQNIINLFTKDSLFRTAFPGEFSYRALKNNKLSLSQVEGLDLLLNASSNLMLTQGLDILQGDLHAQYVNLHDSFVRLKSSLELSIDFSEDVGDSEIKTMFEKNFNDFFNKISSLFSRTQGNISSLLNPDIVLFGQTNAGKSSLFNLLLKHDRSIVSNIAGTTRDYVSEHIFIDGTNYNLIDTAGVRDSEDPIEQIGINRALSKIEKSFFKILLINPYEFNSSSLGLLSAHHFDLIIFTHAELNDFNEKLLSLNLSSFCADFAFLADFHTGSIGPFKTSGPMGPRILLNTGSIGPIDFKGGSIEPLVKKFISQKFNNFSSNHPILLERHRDCISKIYLKTATFSNNIKDLGDVAVVSSELNLIGNHLSELIGIITPDDVLNSIFANFCIGK